jgi:hypothetical protein
LLAVGSPNELRTRSQSPRLEIVGRGFNSEVIELLGKRPEVTHAKTRNGNLLVDLRGDVDTAPLVSLLVESGAEVEEVLRRASSLEAAFLTLMEEPQ